MGIEKGKKLFSQDSVISIHLKRLRQDILRDKNLPPDSNYHPLIGIDSSVWIRQSLGNPRLDSLVLSEYHSIPSVPVVSVSTYFTDKVNLLRKHKFDCILTFDGTKHPLKDETHAIRDSARSSDVTLKDKLQYAYANPDNFTMEEVNEIRKALLVPREDITQQVLTVARQNKTLIACAPFEADSQLVALYNQKVIDLAFSIDTDLLGAGIYYVMKSLSKNGNAVVMSYKKLVTDVLPKEFDHPNITISQEELRLYINILGNDYLPKGNAGDGRVACARIMQTYLGLSSEEEKTAYVNKYIAAHDDPEQFSKSLYHWQHAPAYIIKPTNESTTPKDALQSGEYDVELGSMSAEPNTIGDEFYEREGDNIKLGFIPSEQLGEGHNNENDVDPPTNLQFFKMVRYVRTGAPLDQVAQQTNLKGQRVPPGAMLDFEVVPIKFIITRQLDFWLACRAVTTSELSRDQMVSLIEKLRRNEVDALPMCVLRGGGKYIAVSILELPDLDTSPDWKEGQDALDEIRGIKCACIDKNGFIDKFFSHSHNSKRTRCIKHLKGGSYDLKDVKVSSNLKSPLLPDDNFFVVELCCAPSMRGIGEEERVYPLRLVFHETSDGWELMPTPYSLCGCPVGVLDDCAHRGGAILLLYAIRNLFLSGITFDELVKRLPVNIHTIARQLRLGKVSVIGWHL